MTNNTSKENNKCCTNTCGCGCCTSGQLANFLRHIANYFEKKE